MALEGTHIRVAMEMKDKLGVTDLAKYIPGAVYPDSRYTNNIAREKTHPEDFRNWKVAELDDFRKGWYIHLLYDDAQLEAIMKYFPVGKKDDQGSPFWIGISAVKSLQDVLDMQEFDIKPYLKYLNYVEMPNGETKDGMLHYNRQIQETYSRPIDIDACVEFWTKLGQNTELSNQIRSRSTEYAADPGIMANVKKLYSETVAQLHI